MADWDYLFVSPHADDAVFSAGGIIASLVDRGARVCVITVFSQGPDEATRNREDAEAIALLGAGRIELGFIDLSLRRRSSGLPRMIEADYRLVPEIQSAIDSHISTQTKIIGPLGVAVHPDHQIVWNACAAIKGDVSFYEDVPYALCPHQTNYRLSQLTHVAHQAQRGSQDIALEQRLAIARWWLARPLIRELAPLPATPIAAWMAAGGTPEFPKTELPISLHEERVDVSATMDSKMAAITRYQTQWPRFYPSLAAFRAALSGHSRRIGSPFVVERLFHRA